jgi:hypothetical protein
MYRAVDLSSRPRFLFKVLQFFLCPLLLSRNRISVLYSSISCLYCKFVICPQVLSVLYFLPPCPPLLFVQRFFFLLPFLSPVICSLSYSVLTLFNPTHPGLFCSYWAYLVSESQLPVIYSHSHSFEFRL